MRLEDGMFVYVISEQKLYVYKVVDGDSYWVEWSGGSGSTSLVFNFNNSIEWNIPHGLGLYPSVTTVDELSDRIFGNVEYTDSNNIKITFRF